MYDERAGRDGFEACDSLLRFGVSGERIDL